MLFLENESLDYYKNVTLPSMSINQLQISLEYFLNEPIDTTGLYSPIQEIRDEISKRTQNS